MLSNTNAEYADDSASGINAPAQEETLLYRLERAAAGIGIHSHKTEYMCFNQTGDMPTLNDNSLKLVHKFTYLGSSVSSTETDINTWLPKAVGHMEVKPDQWNKKQFLPSSGRVDTAVWMHYMDAKQTYGEKAWWQLHKNAASNTEQHLEATTHKGAAVQLPTTQTGEVGTNS